MVYRDFLTWQCGSAETYPPQASQNRHCRNLPNLRGRSRSGRVRGDRFRRQLIRRLPELRSWRRIPVDMFTHAMCNLDHAAHGVTTIPPGAYDVQSVLAGELKLGGRNRCSITVVNAHKNPGKLLAFSASLTVPFCPPAQPRVSLRRMARFASRLACSASALQWWGHLKL
jgi:hypothetical protein